MRNIGFDDSGVHCDTFDEYERCLDEDFGNNLNCEGLSLPDPMIIRLIKKQLDDTLLKRIKRKIRSWTGKRRSKPSV